MGKVYLPRIANGSPYRHGKPLVLELFGRNIGQIICIIRQLTASSSQNAYGDRKWQRKVLATFRSTIYNGLVEW